MTLEAALLSALTVVSGCLSWAVKALYERLLSAEKTVIELRSKIEELVKDAADKGAKLEMVKQCQQKECPFISMFSDGTVVKTDFNVLRRNRS